MEEKTRKLRITLYHPRGEKEVYNDCVIGASLVPELEFTGKRIEDYYGPWWKGWPILFRPSLVVTRITSTTLAYKIEALDIRDKLTS